MERKISESNESAVGMRYLQISKSHKSFTDKIFQ